jgi:hypothetical protein
MSQMARIRAITEARTAIRRQEQRVIVDDIQIEQGAAANTIKMLVFWRPLSSNAQQQRTAIDFETGG